MIRLMEKKDKAAIIQLIKEFYEEELIKRDEHFNAERVDTDFDNIFGLDCFLGVVYENDDGSIEGMLCAIVGPKFFSYGNAAQELVWYVRKNSRVRGIELLRDFERRCMEKGIDYILMIGLCNTKAEACYKHLGYEKLETTFKKKLGGE